jgi:serine phosphatase RsbU (regulator of sigma subunit)
MRIIGPLFLFFLFVGQLCVAEETPDSLKRELGKTNDPRKQFLIYEKLFRNIMEKDTEIGNYYLGECFSTAQKAKNDTLELKARNLKMIVLYLEGDYKNLANQGKPLAAVLEKAGLKTELSELLDHIATAYLDNGNYWQALRLTQKVDSLAKETGNYIRQCENLLLRANCYQAMNNHTSEITVLQEAFSIAENQHNDFLKCKAAINIGAAYSDGENRDFAFRYLDIGSKLAFAMKDTDLVYQAQIYLGNAYYYNKEYQRALSIYEQLKPYCTGINHKANYAALLGNIGNVYSDMGEIEKGYQLQKEALVVFEEMGAKGAEAICFNTIGQYHFSKKEYPQAIAFYLKSLALAREVNSMEDMVEVYVNLSQVYEATKNYKEAFESYKLYKQYSDSVSSVSNTKQLTELELNYRFNNKQREEELKQQLEQEKFKRSRYLGGGGMFILILVVAVVIRNNRQRKKANELLLSSNSEILFQKEQVELKNREVEHKNKNITDSINYAKRIQNSILPPDSLVYGLLPDSFVLYKPKDIVSGDFYWVEQKGDVVVFAAVDCTGHGVPGAMMSVLGFNLLTQAVKEAGLTKPSDILNHLDHGVSTMLRQSTESENVKDGMDLALCSLNFTTGELQFAGAYNGLWIVKKEGNECIETKPDKMPIGSNVDGVADQYTNHSVRLEKGDTIYIFTDGYADQFGGPKGKKFKYKQLEQVLVANHHLSMSKQKEALDKTFEDWKGILDQVDDVLVIGVRV